MSHAHGTHILNEVTAVNILVPFLTGQPSDSDTNVRIAMGQGQYDTFFHMFNPLSLTESVDLIIGRVAVTTFFKSFILDV